MFMPRKRGYDSRGVSVPKRSACVFVRRSLSAAFFCASILTFLAPRSAISRSIVIVPSGAELLHVRRGGALSYAAVVGRQPSGSTPPSQNEA
jgi:hypothetical protein